MDDSLAPWGLLVGLAVSYGIAALLDLARWITSGRSSVYWTRARAFRPLRGPHRGRQ